MSTPPTFRFQPGGSLHPDFPGYITRPADHQLVQQVREGQFCYVLTPRQMGKSSLRARATAQLVAEGFACGSVDLSSLDTRNIKAEKWYFSFTKQLCEGLDPELIPRLRQFWKQHRSLTPLVRFTDFLRLQVLSRMSQPVVLFIDEIDTVLKLRREGLNTDDFFAAIRALYNARVDHPEWQRLTFVMLGVATPHDLIDDVDRTPFNIGQAISLGHFTRADLDAFAPGLAPLGIDTAPLLDEVYAWTEGQPVLTQKLCNHLVVSGAPQGVAVAEWVARAVERLFFSADSGELDNNLANVQNRMVNHPTHNLKILELYRRILAGQPARVDLTQPAQVYLRLAGAVRQTHGQWVVACRIYAHYFDAAWVAQAMDQVDRPYGYHLKLWLAKGQPTSRLLTGATLTDALTWRQGRDDVTQQEEEFITRSQQHQVFVARRRTLVLLGVAILAVVLAVVAGWSFLQAKEALADEQEAQQGRVQALDEAQNARDALQEKQEGLLQALDSIENLSDSLRTINDSLDLTNDNLSSTELRLVRQNRALNRALAEAQRARDEAKRQSELNRSLVMALRAQDLSKDSDRHALGLLAYHLFASNVSNPDSLQPDLYRALNAVSFASTPQTDVLWNSADVTLELQPTGSQGAEDARQVFDTLTTTSADSVFLTWNRSESTLTVKAKQQVFEFVGHSADLNLWTVTPKGRYFISVWFDNTLRVYDLQSHQGVALVIDIPLPNAIGNEGWQKMGFNRTHSAVYLQPKTEDNPIRIPLLLSDLARRSCRMISCEDWEQQISAFGITTKPPCPCHE